MDDELQPLRQSKRLKKNKLLAWKIKIEKETGSKTLSYCILLKKHGKFIFNDPNVYDLEEDLLFWTKSHWDITPIKKQTKKRKL